MQDAIEEFTTRGAKLNNVQVAAIVAEHFLRKWKLWDGEGERPEVEVEITGEPGEGGQVFIKTYKLSVTVDSNRPPAVKPAASYRKAA